VLAQQTAPRRIATRAYAEGAGGSCPPMATCLFIEVCLNSLYTKRLPHHVTVYLRARGEANNFTCM